MEVQLEVEKDKENCFINVLTPQNQIRDRYMTDEFDIGNEDEVVDEK